MFFWLLRAFFFPVSNKYSPAALSSLKCVHNILLTSWFDLPHEYSPPLNNFLLLTIIHLHVRAKPFINLGIILHMGSYSSLSRHPPQTQHWICQTYSTPIDFLYFHLEVSHSSLIINSIQYLLPWSSFLLTKLPNYQKFFSSDYVHAKLYVGWKSRKNN